MYVSSVPPEYMSEPLRQTWEQASEGGKKFISAVAHAPEHAERLFPYYNGIRYGTKIGPVLCELIRLAIAQTTQCPICLQGRRDEAFDGGLTEAQIAVLATTDRTAGLPPDQAAAVDFAYKFGSDHFAIGEAEFRALHAHFSEEEVVEIGMLCAQFLGFGRLVMVLGLENPSCSIPVAAATSLTGAEAVVAH